jgi:hypothetical protein
VQDAEVFMDRNYPTLYLYGDDNQFNEDTLKVRIAFGRERKDQIRSDDADWICANVREKGDHGHLAIKLRES